MIDASTSDQPSVTEDASRLTDAFVRTAIRTAGYYAQRIARTLKLPPADIADIRQDLLVEVLRRAAWFDPTRAAWSTFVELVVRHAAQDIADERAAARAVDGGSLDGGFRGSFRPLFEGLAEGDGLDGIWGCIVDRFVQVERKVDVERFAARLPDRLRRLCRLLQTESVGDAQRLSDLSPAEFYRQLQELRGRLRSVGLG